MKPVLLELKAIEKSFFGIPVLKGVSFQVGSGRTLGLAGENGAGKSTLMNILGGNLSADAGEMILNGSLFHPRSPEASERAGVAFIHQELNLFGNLSIAENLFLTQFPLKFARINRRAMHERSAELLSQVGLQVSPDMLVAQLSAGERQLVEIARALNSDPQLLILDEPTTSLTSRETERLFAMLRSLKEQGLAMIYISHVLGDVQQLCDDIVILRDGQVAGSGPASEFNTQRMVSLMVGRDSDQQFPPRASRPTDEVLLKVEQVSQPGVIHDISFALHRGEVLGISGLMGSGRTELARILFGLDPVASGTIELEGSSLMGLSTRQRIQRGLALLTESRHDDGLCLQSSVQENLGLVAASRFAARPFGVLRMGALNAAVEQIRSAVKLTSTADLHRPVRILSGGNQQKVVLGKWLLNEPRVLILDEPTRGIDVGARFEIYTLIDQLASRGAGVLVISSELDELTGICDRILVISQGEIRDELNREAFDRQRILRGALHTERNWEGSA